MDELLAEPVAGCRLVAKVGSGGEGEVWDAVAADGRRIALKLVRPEALIPGPEAAARGRWLVRIDHPSLVRVYRGGVIHRGTYAGWGFVEMAFVEGASLAGAPADPHALERLAGVAQALDLLHAGYWSDGVPLVHRDVKPANLVDASSGLVLVDPSTLRGLDSTELTRIGTPVYAAPEVLTGRFGPPADVYSLGATAAALLTGARSTALRRITEAPDAYDLPPGVQAALAWHPGDRPPSCQAVLDRTLRLPAPRQTQTAVDHPLDRSRPHPDPEDATRSRLSFGEALLLLIALVLTPVTAWAFDLLAPRTLWALAAAAVVGHLLTYVAIGRHLALALVVPPAAWAALLGARVYGRPQRRIWARTTFTGALVAGAVAAPLIWWQTRDPQSAAVAALAALTVTAIAGWAARLGPVTGLVPRVLLLPVWAVGAALLVLGDAAARTGRMVTGQSPAVPLAGRAVGSIVETLRGPGRPPLPWESRG